MKDDVEKVVLTALERWRLFCRGALGYKPVDVVSEWPDRLKRKGGPRWGRLTLAEKVMIRRKAQHDYRIRKAKAARLQI